MCCIVSKLYTRPWYYGKYDSEITLIYILHITIFAKSITL